MINSKLTIDEMFDRIDKRYTPTDNGGLMEKAKDFIRLWYDLNISLTSHDLDQLFEYLDNFKNREDDHLKKLKAARAGATRGDA